MSLSTSLHSLVLYAEVMVDHVEAGCGGDGDEDEESVDVEDIVHQRGFQFQSVVSDFASAEPFEDEEDSLEEERGEQQDSQTLPWSSWTDLLQQLCPAIEGDERSLGEQGHISHVHLTVQYSTA